MFWTGFWVGVLTVLIIFAIISTVAMVIAYKTAPMAEDDE